MNAYLLERLSKLTGFVYNVAIDVRPDPPAPALGLTIHQPHASLIVLGIKDVENRSWRTRHRGPLLIHAGKDIDQHALDRYGHLLADPDDLPRGVLLGTVDLVDVVTDSTSPWADPTCFHWILVNPRLLARPIPCRGDRGLWPVASAVL
jgi:hypothetical protein